MELVDEALVADVKTISTIVSTRRAAHKIPAAGYNEGANSQFWSPI